MIKLKDLITESDEQESKLTQEELNNRLRIVAKWLLTIPAQHVRELIKISKNPISKMTSSHFNFWEAYYSKAPTEVHQIPHIQSLLSDIHPTILNNLRKYPDRLKEDDLLWLLNY